MKKEIRELQEMLLVIAWEVKGHLPILSVGPVNRLNDVIAQLLSRLGEVSGNDSQLDKT